MTNDQKQFTRRQIGNIINEVFDYYDIPNTTKFGMDFESWLNDQGFNGNNGANEHLLEKYHEHLIDTFIYD